MKYKKCNYCGEEIDEGARRCPNCGSLIDVEVDNLEETRDKADDRIEEEKAAGPDNTSEHSDNEVTEGKVNFSEPVSNRDNNRPINNTGLYRNAPTQNRYAYNPHLSSYGAPHIRKSSPLSNGLKVFLTVICSVIPGIGQLAGIIISIVFMNTQDDVQDYADRRSFGLALLIACVVMFLLSCIGCFVLTLLASFQESISY